jgi:hypothetical protein
LLKYFIFKVVYVHMLYARVWEIMYVLWRVFLFLPSCKLLKLFKKFKVFCFSKLLKASPSALKKHHVHSFIQDHQKIYWQPNLLHHITITKCECNSLIPSLHPH